MHLIHATTPLPKKECQRIFDLDSGRYYDYSREFNQLVISQVGSDTGKVLYEGDAALVFWAYLLQLAVMLPKYPDAYISNENH